MPRVVRTPDQFTTLECASPQGQTGPYTEADMLHRRHVVPFAGLLGGSVLAACGGGSAYISTSSSGLSVGNVASGNQPSVGLSYDTGKTGGVGAPAPAAYGSAPAQIATSSSPQFLN